MTVDVLVSNVVTVGSVDAVAVASVVNVGNGVAIGANAQAGSIVNANIVVRVRLILLDSNCEWKQNVAQHLRDARKSLWHIWHPFDFAQGKLWHV